MGVVVKAIIFRSHGGPEVLEYTDFPTPQPGPGEVLVRLKAAALNRLDLWVRNGWPGIRLELPHIPGADGAGELAALGEGVSGWEPGERVVINPNLGCGVCDACRAGWDNRCKNWALLGETRPGTYAEYVALPAANLLRLPDGFSEHTAAAAALTYLTAWHSLMVRGSLRPGETVLVVGASGGVNTAAIEIARLAGATVLAVGSGPEKLALAETMGAHVVIDRMAEPDWSKAVMRLTERCGADVIVDNVGTTFPLSFRAAARGGRILTVGNTGGPKFEIDNRFIFGKQLTIIGSSMGTKQDFAAVMHLVFAGKLRPQVGQTFPLAEAGAAQEMLEAGRQMGKITLAIPG
jgi:NADPH:quinone reductase-like Zn-dependent oxidoreductase